MLVVKSENIYWNTGKINATNLIQFTSDTPHCIASNKASGTCLLTELCFHRFAHLDCVAIDNFSFHYK